MKHFLSLCLILFTSATFSQDTSEISHGTIKVQRQGTLHSVFYDDVNFRLVCKDVYGNINDTAVLSFDLKTTVKGLAYSEQTTGCFISKPMQQKLARLDGIVTLFFSNIKARDRNGSIVSFPDFKAQTGNAREREDY
ncbi:MAG: hypothetical protein K0Q95_1430 [Bacteroidota bacterium]|jgi:hypothetical protein|nr:hypothetical protein [Bacteroidota bacterium]